MSSWHTSQLTYAFGIGGIMSFYGIMGLVAYMLPTDMISRQGRIIFIAVVLLTFPFAILFTYLVARRRRKKEALAESSATESTPVESKPAKVAATGKYPDIDRGITEVVDFLKSSNLGSVGKDAIYSLPWYLVAGVTRSGKSSLVIGSNLDFKTTASQRAADQKLIRPTANVDWRVSSEAVFIDVSGRLMSESKGSDEWRALIESIRSHRPNRPIDGMILAVDTNSILKSEERDQELVAKELRSRIDEVIAKLKVKFPIYVVFTSADSIEGFGDSFSVSRNEAKELVWGSTIPLEKSENAQALFDGEFELLREAAMKRRLARLSAPFPPVKQLRIFNFPLHFGSARRKLGSFISTLFRPDPFSENPFLRGFYLTSAPAAKAASNIPATVGKTYFVERLFRDVILRDRDLVATTIAQRQGAPLFGWALTLIGAAIVGLLLIGSGVSLYNNKKMLDDAKERGERLIAITKTDGYKDPAKADEKTIRTEVNATEDLRQILVKLDDYERNGAPWFMRFGLYSGDRVYKQHLLKVYMSVIENRYKAQTVKRVEADLKKFSESTPVANAGKLTEAEEGVLGKNYDLLKAYLMLTKQFKDKADPTHISTTLKDSWTADGKFPAELKPVALQQLEFWAKQVDREDSDFTFPRISPDSKIIEDTRKKLQVFPAVYRYYKRKVTEISKQIDAEHGSYSVDSILTDKGSPSGFISGNYTVPGAFTRAGLPFMQKAITEANEKLSEDDWVMGETGKSTLDVSSEAQNLEARYYRDYADHWRTFVKGVTVVPYRGKSDATSALQAFTAANSPMKVLLIEIARNTNLSARKENEGWWDWLKSFVVSDDTKDTGGTTQPEKDFKPLFAFVGKKTDKDNAPIDRYGTAIGTVSNLLNQASEDSLKQAAKDLAEEKDPLKLRSTESNITGMLESFKETASSQELALLIQRPLGNLRTMLGADARGQLGKQWTEQVLPAAKEFEACYPFVDSQTECDLTKLTAFLNPVDGTLSKFYKERLERYFEESNGVLKLKDSAEVKFSKDFVAYLNSAFAIRKALYGTSPTPKFEYEFSFKPSKDAIIEIVIDGQKITSEGTASIKGTFPAAGSAETGVILSSAGAATTPAPATSTTPSSSPPSSGSSSLKFPGNWGLFRFVDAGKPSKQAGGEYNISYSVGGKPISATIKPSGGDLFDKAIFRAVKAPQSLFE